MIFWWNSARILTKFIRTFPKIFWWNFSRILVIFQWNFSTKNTVMLWVLIRSASLLMSTHNICFHGEKRKIPALFGWKKKAYWSVKMLLFWPTQRYVYSFGWNAVVNWFITPLESWAAANIICYRKNLSNSIKHVIMLLCARGIYNKCPNKQFVCVSDMIILEMMVL